MLSRFSMMESLQPRVLFALPPANVFDTRIELTVLDGQAPLAGDGTFVMQVRSSKPYYDILDGDSLSSTGKFTYARLSTKAAVFTADDSLLGRLTATFTFVSPTTGQYSIVRAGGGSQSGGFNLQAPNMSRLKNNTLEVFGTIGGDSIDLYPANSRLVAITRNNVTQKYDTRDFDSIQVFAGEADDSITSTKTVQVPLYLAGEGGKDTLIGGGGNDTLAGGASRNILTGGPGDDRLNGSGASDTLQGQEGADRMYGGGGDDSLDGGGGVDRAWGGEGNDTLIGGSSNDKLFGELDNDLLVGNAGDDWMSGGAGNDALNAGTGNDTLFGDGGSDGLFGQDGDDTIFAKDSIRDSVVGGTGTDSATFDQALIGDDVTGIELTN